MGYDRHNGHAEIFGSGGGLGRAAKSSYDGKRREGARGNSLKAFNPAQSGKYGSGRSKRPDQVGQLYVDGDHRTDGPGTQYAGHASRPGETLAKRDTRLRKSDQIGWNNDHPQHPNWRRAVVRGPNRRIVGS